MLIRFELENYLSFKDSAMLDMVPGLTRSKEHHVVRGKEQKNNKKKDIDALKTAFIYGANASGKSNFIRGMDAARNFILYGPKSSSDHGSTAFKLDPACRKLPSKFSFTIRVEDTTYEYSFSYDGNVVQQECLKEVKKNWESIIFSRGIKENRKDYTFNVEGIDFKSADDEQFFHFTEKGTPESDLFLTECKNRGFRKNIPYAKAILDVLDWFENKLSIVFPSSAFVGLEVALHDNEDAQDEITNILSKFDIGINRIGLTEVEPELALEGIPEHEVDKIKKRLKKGDSGAILTNIRENRYLIRADDGVNRAFKLATTHIDSEGEKVEFDLDEESDGTRRLLEVLPGMLGAFSSNQVFVIDELDRSLHSAISRSIISSFLAETRGEMSQLIVTTHDASLLDQELLRKDEIWFTQKNQQGQSCLYSLEEFQDIRADKDINTGYLAGRFGGVPIITETSSIKFDR